MTRLSSCATAFTVKSGVNDMTRIFAATGQILDKWQLDSGQQRNFAQA